MNGSHPSNPFWGEKLESCHMGALLAGKRLLWHDQHLPLFLRLILSRSPGLSCPTACSFQSGTWALRAVRRAPEFIFFSASSNPPKPISNKAWVQGCKMVAVRRFYAVFRSPSTHVPLSIPVPINSSPQARDCRREFINKRPENLR